MFTVERIHLTYSRKIGPDMVVASADVCCQPDEIASATAFVIRELIKGNVAAVPVTSANGHAAPAPPAAATPAQQASPPPPAERPKGETDDGPFGEDPFAPDGKFHGQSKYPVPAPIAPPPPPPLAQAGAGEVLCVVKWVNSDYQGKPYITSEGNSYNRIKTKDGKAASDFECKYKVGDPVILVSKGDGRWDIKKEKKA